MHAHKGKNAPPISPLALEAVKRIDVLFDIGRGINGKAAEQRLAVRQELSAPVLADLKGGCRPSAGSCRAIPPWPRRWITCSGAGTSGPLRPLPRRQPHLPYEQRRRKGTARYRFGQEVVAVRRLRPRRRAGGGDVMYTLIGTAKLNNVDPQAWLADVLHRIAGTPQSQLDELLPWNWQDSQRHDQAA